MRIITERLILRPPTLKDAADIVENVNNLKVSRYLAHIPFPYSVKNAKYFIRLCRKQQSQIQCTDLSFVVELRREKKVIGCVGFIRIDRFTGKADIGYWLGKNYWRNGFAFEAVGALIKFAFNKFKLQRLEAAIYADNLASQALVKKLGFKKEGVRHRASRSLATGVLHDATIYALLKAGKCR
jgi:[ribosomal protein S5]-alanine N-acetyltransferase